MNLKIASGQLGVSDIELKDRPLRTKLNLQFQHLNPGLKLTMRVPLDPTYLDEAKALTLFGEGDNTISIVSHIDLELEAERETFKGLMKEVYTSEIGELLRNAELTKISDSDLRKVLQPLVNHGQNVFFRLFVSDAIEYEGYDEDNVKVAKPGVISALTRPQLLTLHSGDPLFPWAFLYYDQNYVSSNNSTIKPERFWGFMHEIQEELESTPRTKKLAPNPEIVTAVDSYLDDTGMHDAEDHPFRQVKTIPAGNVGDLGTQLANFEGDCFYFYGHADHLEPPSQATSWLELQRAKLHVSDLEMARAPRFKNNPVVAFLNGCKTSPLTTWNASTMVGFLCTRGNKHLCCIASVNELPASFAAEFAKKFWEKFLINRLPIGTALRSARCHMLEQWNNPLGLLYSLFGRVDTYVPFETASRSEGAHADMV
jgi:hypothetical protein